MIYYRLKQMKWMYKWRKRGRSGLQSAMLFSNRMLTWRFVLAWVVGALFSWHTLQENACLYLSIHIVHIYWVVSGHAYIYIPSYLISYISYEPVRADIVYLITTLVVWYGSTVLCLIEKSIWNGWATEEREYHVEIANNCSKTGGSYREGVCKGLCLSTVSILYTPCFP